MEKKRVRVQYDLAESAHDPTDREQNPPKKKSGRPLGSKNTKPKPKMEVLIPRLIDIDQILKNHPTFLVKQKSRENGHWIYTPKEVSSGTLDRNILLWIISRISLFESIADEDHEINGCPVRNSSDAGTESCDKSSSKDMNEDEQEDDWNEIDESEADERSYAFISRKYWLDRIRGAYSLHIAFLEQSGVIEVDHSYRYRRERNTDDGTKSKSVSEERRRIGSKRKKRTKTRGRSSSGRVRRILDEATTESEVEYSVTQSDHSSFEAEFSITPIQQRDHKNEYSVTQTDRSSMEAEYLVTQSGRSSVETEYSVTPIQKFDHSEEFPVTQSTSGTNKNRKLSQKNTDSKENESKSKGYRISEGYISALKKVQIEIKIPKKPKPHLPFHLSDKFFKHISFDYSGAEAYLMSLDQENLTRKEARSLWHMAISVLRLKNKDFRTHRDLTSFRANNVVTQMNGNLRRFLAYKGQKLYSIDLKNSQPLFLALLFKIITEKVSIKVSNNSNETSKWLLFGDHISVTKYSNAEFPSKTKVFEILETMNLAQSASMTQIKNTKYLHEKQQAHLEDDVVHFYNLCIEGRLYEHFAEIHNAKRRSKKLERNQMKDKLLIFLMDQNDSHNNTIRSIFTKHFPNVLEMTERIKEQRYQNMGVLLQCLESHTFLDVVARRLHDEYQIPFCTIHDCIITTEENITVAWQVIMDAFAQEYGVQPNLDVTCWQDETYIAAPAVPDSMCTNYAEAVQSELGSSIEEAPTVKQINSESVYVLEAIDEPSKQRSFVVEPPTSLSELSQKKLSPETVRVMSALEEFHIDDEDLPQTEEELGQCVELLEAEERKARQSGDMESATRYENMILVMKHGRLRLALRKFSPKAMRTVAAV
jgi:hypothetical protein